MTDVRAWRIAENERTERKLADWEARYGDRDLEGDEAIEAEKALGRACAAVDYTRRMLAELDHPKTCAGCTAKPGEYHDPECPTLDLHERAR